MNDFKNQSPWGTPPGGGSPSGNGSGTRQDPPSLDDIIKNFQKTINKLSGGKSGGSRPFVIATPLEISCLSKTLFAKVLLVMNEQTTIGKVAAIAYS